MNLREEPLTSLEDHARVPIAFEVRSVLAPTARQPGALEFELAEQPVRTPWVKDYDAVPGNHPGGWARRFDLANWGLISAWVEGKRAAGVVLAFDTPGLDLLEGRRDVALIWDLRVAPDHRRQGIGEELFAAAKEWARTRGCCLLGVETQNINVAACRFYARRGCALRSVRPHAYPEFPDEVQFLWYLEI